MIEPGFIVSLTSPLYDSRVKIYIRVPDILLVRDYSDIQRIFLIFRQFPMIKTF